MNIEKQRIKFVKKISKFLTKHIKTAINYAQKSDEAISKINQQNVEIHMSKKNSNE